jgi:hypothetical protein
MDVELEQIIMRDDYRARRDRTRETRGRRLAFDPRLDRPVIDGETRDRDARVGVLGVYLRARAAEVARRAGFEVENDANLFYTPSLSF